MLDLSTRDRCFVIAEAGTSHAAGALAARLEKAKRYVLAASEAGADAVKFQWFTADGGAIKTDMFCWIDGDERRSPRWEDSALSLDDWRQVKEFADALGIMFLASAFQTRTVQWLNDLKLEATKVASRAAKNFPYGDAPSPFLISMGMVEDGEGFEEAITAQINTQENLYLIQCEAKYPSTEGWAYAGPGRAVGFSDHSGQPFLGIDAISRGCKLLEVHFGLDIMDTGPDTPACLTWDGLRLVCEARDFWAERMAA